MYRQGSENWFQTSFVSKMFFFFSDLWGPLDDHRMPRRRAGTVDTYHIRQLIYIVILGYIVYNVHYDVIGIINLKFVSPLS